MIEAAPSRLTSTYFGGNSTALGAVGGGESQTLTLGQLPAGITSTGIFNTSVGNLVGAPIGGITSFSGNPGAQVWQAFGAGAIINFVQPTASGTVTSNNTGGSAHRTVQPTIACNYILRII